MNRRRSLRSSAGALILAHADGLFAAVADPKLAGIEALTGDGAKTLLDAVSLQNLKNSLRGALLLPDEAGYDPARRVIDRSIDKRPALIVQPSGAADVRTAVDFARSHSLLLAVKCGGHSGFRSTCDGGMLIDLSRFRGVRVDPAARIAQVAGGCLLGEVDHEAMSWGLVTPAGVVSHTGVGGLTLGAGFGRLQRRWGLTLDNLRAVDIVTADGQMHRANADENADLYWAVRGGGGNFGIVTSFEFQLYPLQRRVVGGRLSFPRSRAREVLEAYADFSMQAPEELYADFIMGERCIIDICWSGEAGKAESTLAPLRKLGTPLDDSIKSIDYVVMQRERDRSDPLTRSDERRGVGFKTGIVKGFGAGLARALAVGYEEHPQRRTSIYIQHAGGAIGRFAPDATAFPHRGATHVMSLTVSWPLSGEDATHARYLEDYWASLSQFTDGYYANLVDQDPGIVDANYRHNLPRLKQVKRRYDPTNLFRLNANIRPA